MAYLSIISFTTISYYYANEYIICQEMPWNMPSKSIFATVYMHMLTRVIEMIEPKKNNNIGDVS